MLMKLADTELNEWAKSVIDHYGADHQKVVTIEELGELIQAITKDLRGNPNLKNIREEIGDVLLCVRELVLIYGGINEIEKSMEHKMSIVNKRMNGRGCWVPNDEDEWECSECGEVIGGSGDFPNFCPNCGSDMRELC